MGDIYCVFAFFLVPSHFSWFYDILSFELYVFSVKLVIQSCQSLVIIDCRVLNRMFFGLLFIQAVNRYEKEFGIRNYRFTVGKVEFVVVDAQTLDGKQGKN